VWKGDIGIRDITHIKIAIENSLLSKLSYETILSFVIHQKFYPSTVSHRSFISTHLGQICNQDELCPLYQYPLFTLVFFTKKIRTLFIITLHIFSHFSRTFNLYEVYWLYLTLVTWISLAIYCLQSVTALSYLCVAKILITGPDSS
jgi:hypothetical protein